MVFYANLATSPPNLHISSQIENLLGFSVGEWLGDSFLWYKQTHPEDRGSLEAKVGELCKNGTPISIDVRLMSKFGKILWFHLEVRIVFDDSKPVLLHGIAFDITGHKENEIKLDKLNKELNTSNQAISTMAKIAAHDLKSPVRSIPFLLTQLEEVNDFSEDSKKYIDIIYKRVKKIGAGLDAILNYIQYGDKDKRKRMVDVKQLVMDIWKLIDKNKDFRMFTGRLPVFSTNYDKLSKVFGCFIENAVVHHHRDDGEITILCEDNDEQFYVFCVCDDGPGIDPIFHNKLFAIFENLGSNRLGIGLAMTKRIIETYNGRIWLESTPGYGAKFFFTWPKNID